MLHLKLNTVLLLEKLFRILMAVLISFSTISIAVVDVQAAPAGTALQFNGTSQYVSIPTSINLNTPTFTVETWLLRTGDGVGVTTGTGGITSAIPLVAKGTSEGETAAADVNYFFGIDASSGVLVADFEEAQGQPNPSQNHPLSGNTVITRNVWHHAAVTYDGTTWKLYLDGVLDKSMAVGRTPNTANIGPVGLAASIRSNGTTIQGYFAGVLDETRIWNRALDASEILANKNLELESGSGLVARWGLNEGAGTVAVSSVGSYAGTLKPLGTEPSWVAGFPKPPAPPTSLSAASLESRMELTWTASPSPSIAGYNVFRGTTSGFTPGAPLNGALIIGTSFTDSTGMSGTTYYYVVKAVDTYSLVSQASNETSGSPLPDTTAPSAPTDLNATGVEGAVNLTWTAPGDLDVAGYNLYRDASSGFTPGTPLNTSLITALDYSDISGVAGTTYYYVVKAVDTSANASVVSNEASAAPLLNTTPPAPPTGFTATAQLGQIKLDWTAPGDADLAGFNLYRDVSTPVSLINPLNGSTPLPKTSVTFTDTTVSKDVTFYYAITAVDIANNASIAVEANSRLVAGLQFDGTNDYVTFGNAAGLGLQNFTVETWFKRTATGVAASSGGNGVLAVPLVTKGSGEEDGSNKDENYILGIRSSDNVLAADFEIYDACNGRPKGDNNPIVGVTPIVNDTWYHAAFTYDGAALKLYLNGKLESTLPSTCLPRYDSIQHSGLGTYLNSTGATQGYFAGVLDEVRIWNYARSQNQIQSSINTELLTSPTGLVARWDLDEGKGTTTTSNGGTYPGTLTNGPVWAIPSSPFNATIESIPPSAPAGFFATGGDGQVALGWTANTEPDLAGYNIYRSLTSPVASTGPINGSILVGKSLTSFTDTGRTNGIPLYYVITAVDVSGNESAVSSEVTATPGGIPPVAPSGLTVSPSVNNYSQMNLSWTDNSSNEIRFEVERSSNGEAGPFAQVGTAAANTPAFQDLSLSPVTQYCYRVRSVSVSTPSDFSPVVCASTAAEGSFALEFTSTSGTYVTFGDPAKLDLSTFTIETWFKRTGVGTISTTGSGGVTNALPLVTHGSPQDDGSNVDADWVLVIDDTTDTIAADFEDMASGLNHPVYGKTPIANNVWHHAAATYDGTTWRLYLDGNLETELVVGAFSPRADTIQHAALGTMLTSTGTPNGYFQGALDEARVWNVALTQQQIRANINNQITNGSGLVARWGLNEGSGNRVNDSVTPAATGTLTGTYYSWVASAPFDLVFDTVPPAAPSNLMASAGAGKVQLEWTANSEPDLRGYNVYRSTTSPVSINTPINLFPITSPSYVDENVTAGTQYYYAVTAIDTSANESTPSNEVSAIPAPPPPPEALDLGSNHAYVQLGDNADLPQFTLETWLRRDGVGVAQSTGTGGQTLIPLITNGTADAETANADVNYFMGIRESDGVLCADFEEAQTGTSPGLNHPVCGTTSLTNRTWYHAAATYDGSTWKLYLNSNLEATLTVGQPANSANISQLAFGTSMTTANSTLGFFDGVLDEVRIWDVARTQVQIAGTINQKITSPQPNLVGRWGMDEGTGAIVNDSAETKINGSILGTGYAWVTGSPFNAEVNLPPDEPSSPLPVDNATGISTTATLSANVSDPENHSLNVTFYGRPVAAAAGPEFTIVILPDTQNYSATYPAIFNAQAQWVVDHKTTDNIIFVGGLGDIVDSESITTQWTRAQAAYDILHTGGVPFGVALGNHDGAPSSTTNFNSYFGSQVAAQSTYGGRFGTSDYDNTYSLFSASGIDFIMIFIEYDDSMTNAGHPVLQWANGILQANSTRKAIVVSHNMLQGGTSTAFSTQGQAIYDALKGNPNLFMILGGHLDVASRRTDTYNGNTVNTLRSDYQFVDSQQSGYLRIMRFVPNEDMIYVRTYSPTQNKDYDKSDAAQNNFNLPFQMDGVGFELIGTANGVPSGGTATVTWAGLDPSSEYEWYTIATDGTHQTTSPTWSFTTKPPNTPPVITEGDNVTVHMSKNAYPNPFALTLNATDVDGDTLTWSVSSQAANGTALVAGSGPSVSAGFSPTTDYVGTDSFTVQVLDGVASDSITVNVVVDPTYTIFGNTSVAGASLQYDLGGSKTVVAGNDGSYSIIVPDGWSGTVSPSLPGYDFTPASREYASVLSDQPAQDYTTTAITVTGTISMQGRSSTAGITATLTGTTYGPYLATSTSDLSSNLVFVPVAGGTYIFTTNQPRYLNITTALAKEVSVTGSRNLPALVLRGGNAVNDEVIDILDASLIGSNYKAIAFNQNADVNFDGVVDILDLSLMGGNWHLIAADAYASWIP